jgi:hypothetical protein
MGICVRAGVGRDDDNRWSSQLTVSLSPSAFTLTDLTTDQPTVWLRRRPVGAAQRVQTRESSRRTGLWEFEGAATFCLQVARPRAYGTFQLPRHFTARQAASCGDTSRSILANASRSAARRSYAACKFIQKSDRPHSVSGHSIASIVVDNFDVARPDVSPPKAASPIRHWS